MAVAVALLTATLAVLAVLVLGLLRSHAEILRALHEAGVSLDPDGQAGPRTAAGLPGPRRRSDGIADVSGQAPNGDAVHIGVLGADRPTLVAFLTSGCLTCRGFWSAFADGVTLDDSRLVIVTKGPTEESPAALLRLAPRSLPTVMSDEAWGDYGVEVAPYFVLVDGAAGRVLGEGAASSWEQVERLMEQARADVEPDGLRRAEDALRAAGIEPGDPTLHHAPIGEPAGEPDDR